MISSSFINLAFSSFLNKPNSPDFPTTFLSTNTEESQSILSPYSAASQPRPTVTFASFSTTFERFTFSPFVKLTATFVSSLYNPYPLQSACKPPEYPAPIALNFHSPLWRYSSPRTIDVSVE